eukprot:CAMPEP_0175890956 /NCGR_PEP_ID=MMETSP0107_2-20121207/48117_1 /TAXON_ID=195067 ORGANISM="Goniomonas pacifica, Strain CCMP1869" /NCGR_SAMPLE_ID=MMETSP0107_2 /ASSEMBLY_ACC=CAM_ASM_000203 /LENGTH=140 /DNA_ID=CAMNT_0017211781 /DNA_START=49 /DNA_END=468 /DNA_ORIENTATION=+
MLFEPKLERELGGWLRCICGVGLACTPNVDVVPVGWGWRERVEPCALLAVRAFGTLPAVHGTTAACGRPQCALLEETRLGGGVVAADRLGMSVAGLYEARGCDVDRRGPTLRCDTNRRFGWCGLRQERGACWSGIWLDGN